MTGAAMAQGCAASPTGTPQIKNGGGPRTAQDTFTIVLEEQNANAAKAAVASLKAKIERIAGVRILRIYDMDLFALVVSVTDPQKFPALLRTLAAEPCFESIQLDRNATFNAAPAASSPQMNPPKGLDRIDQPLLGPPLQPLDGKFNFAQTGVGVNVYVVDSGIDLTHNDFEGRAFYAYSVVPNDRTDCNGHGTAVAGVAGGRTFGVAKEATIYSVRVASEGPKCEVKPYHLADGIRWVMQNAKRPAVVNVSLGSSVPDELVDRAVRRLVNSGVTVVVAAGNDHQSSGECRGEGSPSGYSPARVREAITVGATFPETDDELRDRNPSLPGSNFGSCVDLYAPGAKIETARAAGVTPTSCTTHPGSTNSVDCMGTSFAAPHVAGCAALFLQSPPMPSPMPADVWAWLRARAVSGQIKTDETGPRADVDQTHGGTPNLMLHCIAVSGAAQPSP
jgi:subtilisin family serine protease